MSKSVILRAQLPAKFKCLFVPATADVGRYKVFYGGRGSMKSWTVAQALLIRGCHKKRRDPLLPGETEHSPVSFRVWCAREIQNSIEESVYHLLAAQIKRLGLQQFYDVQKTKILGKKNTSAEGTEFLFYGLHYNVEERKSMESVDILWIEEGNLVSKYAWETVIPTIRKEYADGTCSEIWVTFNPDLEDDEAYRRFVIPANRPTNAIVIEVSYRDNPWFPKVLQVEMENLKRTDPDAYLTVYEGKTRQALEGAVFAKELRAAKAAGRICRFNVEQGSPVSTFWDLGRADYTSIWFIQRVGLQWRCIDFYENRFEHIDHYIGVLQSKNFVYRTHFLPHDAKAKQLGTKYTVEEQLRGTDPDDDKPMRDVRVLPVQNLVDQHNALRSLFPNLYFEQDRCSAGLARLGRYSYTIDPNTKRYSTTPLHDDNSHAASALLQFAIAAKEPERKRQRLAAQTHVINSAGHAQGWMG